MKRTKKKIAVIMTAVLMIASIYQTNSTVQAAKRAVKVGKGMYTLNEKKGTARFDKVSKKSVTSLTIPATVKIGKITYKVTAVRANALKGNTKIKKLTIGKNVKKIGKNSFSCKNLKSINIKTTKLTLKSVGKNAFKGLNSKVKIKVPASKFDAYQKLLKARGVNGSNQVINSDKPTATTSPKKPTTLPDPTIALQINPSQDKGLYWPNTTTEADAEVGKRVEFIIRTDIPLDFYGYWEEVKNVKSDYKSICRCGLVATSNEDRIIHSLQSGHDGYTVRTKGNNAFDASVWHPDSNPCGIVYHATLPEGLEIIEDSISVAQLSRRDTLLDAVGSEHYKVSVEGRNLTISIDNIKTDGKANGFCVPSGKLSYLPIVASFSVKVTDSASTVNPVSASVSYSQGQYNNTIITNTVTVNKK